MADPRSLLPVAEAQARIIALSAPLPVETVAIADASGRWAASDIHAVRTQPAADLSAMDGYAIRFGDLPGPWTVIGESAAGSGFDRSVGVAEAARIFTGAPLPAGSDTILVQEDAERDGAMLRLTGDGPPAHAAHVRRAGSDFALGDRLIERGDLLTPARLALAVTGGHGALCVRHRPRVAILSTGDELVPPGAPADGLKLPSSNAPMLHALASRLGAEVIDHGIARDDLAAIEAALRMAASDADIVVTTGGASVGDRDLVRPALAAAGASLDFWRVAMKPGKPLMAGRLGDAVILGLPGNPVSAFVTAQLFLLPLLRSMGGASSPLPQHRPALLAGSLGRTGSRAEYLRATLGPEGVTALAGQDSAGLSALAQADVLIVRPADSPASAAGEKVEIINLA